MPGEVHGKNPFLLKAQCNPLLGSRDHKAYIGNLDFFKEERRFITKNLHLGQISFQEEILRKPIHARQKRFCVKLRSNISYLICFPASKACDHTPVSRLHFVTDISTPFPFLLGCSEVARICHPVIVSQHWRAQVPWGGRKTWPWRKLQGKLFFFFLGLWLLSAFSAHMTFRLCKWGPVFIYNRNVLLIMGVLYQFWLLKNYNKLSFILIPKC